MAQPINKNNLGGYDMKREFMFNKLIVHGGQAHRDDFLAACLVAGMNPSIIIERREPQESDFNDSEVLILDVGMRDNPELGNFDHHIEGIKTSFSWLNEVFELGLEEESWYQPSIILDNRGPFALGKELDVTPDSMKGLISPIEQAMLGLFTQTKEIKEGDPLFSIMREIGLSLIKFGQMRKELYVKWSSCSFVKEMDGAKLLIIKEVSHPKMADFAKRFGGIDAIISINFRTKTIELKRLNDSPKIDGLKIKESCSFVHKTGFLAVLKTADLEEALEIIKEAIV